MQDPAPTPQRQQRQRVPTPAPLPVRDRKSGGGGTFRGFLRSIDMAVLELEERREEIGRGEDYASLISHSDFFLCVLVGAVVKKARVVASDGVSEIIMATWCS
jgi:hypothetical protein